MVALLLDFYPPGVVHIEWCWCHTGVTRSDCCVAQTRTPPGRNLQLRVSASAISVAWTQPRSSPAQFGPALQVNPPRSPLLTGLKKRKASTCECGLSKVANGKAVKVKVSCTALLGLVWVLGDFGNRRIILRISGRRTSADTDRMLRTIRLKAGKASQHILISQKVSLKAFKVVVCVSLRISIILNPPLIQGCFNVKQKSF